jgi:hypothetical protein
MICSFLLQDGGFHRFRYWFTNWMLKCYIRFGLLFIASGSGPLFKKLRDMVFLLIIELSPVSVQDAATSQLLLSQTPSNLINYSSIRHIRSSEMNISQVGHTDIINNVQELHWEASNSSWTQTHSIYVQYSVVMHSRSRHPRWNRLVMRILGISNDSVDSTSLS